VSNLTRCFFLFLIEKETVQEAAKENRISTCNTVVDL
jgi:hypothetical protein